ncbi:hypothetical protein [Herbaspirillum sp. LeCh32-8]|uniref:hypothetical protein n=1 Tax=Herbaspirillum sp. LeCh32-8 TaxID=2821356 RepID=UPI001AE4527D|nr:hypothetical protein [Herbaspirillum sp. LeCh32-8]
MPIAPARLMPVLPFMPMRAAALPASKPFLSERFFIACLIVRDADVIAHAAGRASPSVTTLPEIATA